MVSKYPKKLERSERPYRLWDAKAGKELRWRCYKAPENAHRGARLAIYEVPVGTTLEVINCNTRREIGQYTLSAVGHIKFQ